VKIESLCSSLKVQILLTLLSSSLSCSSLIASFPPTDACHAYLRLLDSQDDFVRLKAAVIASVLLSYDKSPQDEVVTKLLSHLSHLIRKSTLSSALITWDLERSWCCGAIQQDYQMNQRVKMSVCSVSSQSCEYRRLVLSRGTQRRRIRKCQKSSKGKSSCSAFSFKLNEANIALLILQTRTSPQDESFTSNAIPIRVLFLVTVFRYPSRRIDQLVRPLSAVPFPTNSRWTSFLW